MKLKQYDKILLKDGATAYIVEIFDGGEAFIADIDRNGDTDTDEITIDDIEKVL